MCSTSCWACFINLFHLKIWLWSEHTHFQSHIKDKYLEHFLWNLPQMNAIGPHWWFINIGSGKGMLPSVNISLSDSMLIKFYGTIWRLYASLSWSESGVKKWYIFAETIQLNYCGASKVLRYMSIRSLAGLVKLISKPEVCGISHRLKLSLSVHKILFAWKLYTQLSIRKCDP